MTCIYQRTMLIMWLLFQLYQSGSSLSNLLNPSVIVCNLVDARGDQRDTAMLIAK